MASIVYIVWCIDALLVFFLFHTTWCINVYTRMVHYRSWSSSYSPHILVHCHVFYTRMVQSILTPTCIPALLKHEKSYMFVKVFIEIKLMNTFSFIQHFTIHFNCSPALYVPLINFNNTSDFGKNTVV